MGLRPRFTTSHAITAALTQIERARGFLEAAKLSEEWLRRMGERALLLEAHHTTHIEGTHLTLEQSERLLAGESVPEADPDDARELLNYRTAFEFVSAWLGEVAPITEALVREIHRHLVSGVRGGAAAPGEYRRVQNYVVNAATGKPVYTPPPPLDVPIQMRELVEWLNEEREVHPVLVSGIAQFQLVHVHPFLDGNGRTSRLLSTLCLYRAGYDFKRLFTLSEYYDRDRPAFYRAIQGVRERDMDLTGWLEFFTGGLATQLMEVQQRGERIIKGAVIAKKHRLSERQALALDQVLEHGKLTIVNLQQLLPDTNRRTLQRDLKGMVELELLRAQGQTNRQEYVPGPLLG